MAAGPDVTTTVDFIYFFNFNAGTCRFRRFLVSPSLLGFTEFYRVFVRLASVLVGTSMFLPSYYRVITEF